MKFYLLSDNADTYMGMRLAGIDGVVVNTKEELLKELGHAMARTDLGLVLITDKLVGLCREEIYEKKRSQKRPLIVEIPHKDGADVTSALERYVSEAIGVKL